MKNLILFLLLISCSVFAEKADNFQEIFTKGKFDVELRLGFEHSSVENSAAPDYALHLRSRMGFRSAELAGLGCYAQAHANTNAVERFFDGRNAADSEASSKRDTIADPQGGRMHQLYVDFRGIADTLIRLGRMEIILDDARMVGNIGWRQNGQSFDGIMAQNNSLKGLTLTGAYLKRINSIFLTDSGIKHLGILHAHVNFEKTHNFSAFGYFLDTKGGARDNYTLGTRVNGKFFAHEEMDILYDFTYAMQDDYRNGKGHDGHMFNAFLGMRVNMLSFGAGYSYLSAADSSNAFGYDTLASTAHKFNGWADQFLKTNGGNLINGLEDIYLQMKVKALGTVFLTRYHWFDTTSNNGAYNKRYGTELDFLIQKTIEVTERHKVKVQAKMAFYDAAAKAGNPSKDEKVFWLRLIYKF